MCDSQSNVQQQEMKATVPTAEQSQLNSGGKEMFHKWTTR